MPQYLEVILGACRLILWIKHLQITIEMPTKKSRCTVCAGPGMSYAHSCDTCSLDDAHVPPLVLLCPHTHPCLHPLPDHTLTPCFITPFVSYSPGSSTHTSSLMYTEELWNSPPGPPTWSQYDKELVFKDQSVTGDVIIEMPTLESSCVPPQMVYTSNNDMSTTCPVILMFS